MQDAHVVGSQSLHFLSPAVYISPFRVTMLSTKSLCATNDDTRAMDETSR